MSSTRPTVSAADAALAQFHVKHPFALVVAGVVGFLALMAVLGFGVTALAV
jgi:hypothetical protein